MDLSNLGCLNPVTRSLFFSLNAPETASSIKNTNLEREIVVAVPNL